MDVVPATEETANMICRLCGNGYPESAGRVHGSKFSCWTCLNIQQTVRRNLGTTVPLNEFSPEETLTFFQKVPETKEEKDGKVSWTTIRGQLLKVMTQRHLSRFAAKVEVEELPLSVYETRGWKKETVERFPQEWNETYNDYIYKVPIRTVTWEEAFETVNEKILQLEKEQQRKRERRTATKVASTAANALGPLNSLETSLVKLLTKADAVPQEDFAGKKLCREFLEKAKIWKQQAHAAVTQQEQSKGSAEVETALTPLPFDAAAVKTLCKQAAEGMKEVRTSFPKKEAKAKAAPKDLAANEDGQGAPKRRRTKGAA
eukprot:s612_g15.t1